MGNYKRRISDQGIRISIRTKRGNCSGPLRRRQIGVSRQPISWAQAWRTFDDAALAHGEIGHPETALILVLSLRRSL